MMRLLFSSCVLAILLGCAPPDFAQAATVPAASCENKAGQLDVQNAISTAVDGDTVTIPAGECTWSTNVTLSLTKGLTIQGNGTCTGSPCTWTGSTTIHGKVQISAGALKSYRVTGLFFDVASKSSHVIDVGRADLLEGSHAIRIDNNKFNGQVTADCWCWGLMDHNEWTTEGRLYPGGLTDLYGTTNGTSCPTHTANCDAYTTILIAENASDGVSGVSAFGDGGAGSYRRDLTIGLAGSGAAWVIEDNYFHNFKLTAVGASCPTVPCGTSGFAVVDSRSGGRQTFRRNSVENLTWVVHDARTGNERGTRQYEVLYNNFKWVNLDGTLAGVLAPFNNFGSGSGYIRGNRFQTSGWTNGSNATFTMQNWRSVGNILGTPTGGIDAGLTDPWYKNANGVQDSTSTFCLGGAPHNTLLPESAPIGTCTDFSQRIVTGPTVEIDGYGALYPQNPVSCGSVNCGYPARDQVGAGKTDAVTGAQTIEPLYFYDNRYCIGSGTSCNPNAAVDDVTVFNGVPLVSATSTAGAQARVTGGSQAHIIDGRDYFYGSGIGTQYPGWTEYTYPHPLRPDATPDPDPLTGTPSISAFHGATFAIFIWPRSTDANHKAYNVYRCLTSDPCNVLVKTITPASAAAAKQSDTMFYDTNLYTAAQYWYSVSDVNTSDIVGAATTPVSITVSGKD